MQFCDCFCKGFTAKTEFLTQQNFQFEANLLQTQTKHDQNNEKLNCDKAK